VSSTLDLSVRVLLDRISDPFAALFYSDTADLEHILPVKAPHDEALLPGSVLRCTVLH
jgi:hypothetical protein